MITCYTALDAHEANLLVFELKASGIDAVAVEDTRAVAYGRTSTNALHVQVQVHHPQLEEARRVVARFVEVRQVGGEGSGSPWICPSCGLSNAPTFDYCWSCLAAEPGSQP
jgi:methionine synthase II (cobalamin-independent)